MPCRSHDLLECRKWGFKTGFNQQFTYGVVSEGIFVEILRKIRVHLQKKTKKTTFLAPGKGAEILRKVCGNFAEICGTFSAMTPSRTTP